MNNTPVTQEQFSKLQADFNDLQTQFFKNNFSSNQIFTKNSTFSNSVKLPIYTTLPSCEPGQICVYSTAGTYKLMIATATNTWTVCGTQS